MAPSSNGARARSCRRVLKGLRPHHRNFRKSHSSLEKKLITAENRIKVKSDENCLFWTLDLKRP